MQDELWKIIHADDPLPGLERYKDKTLSQALRLALNERFKSACHWQQSAWQSGAELREVWDLAGELAVDHDATPSRIDPTCCQAHKIQALMLKQHAKIAGTSP